MNKRPRSKASRFTRVGMELHDPNRLLQTLKSGKQKERLAPGKVYVEPRSAEERRLAEIWARVLGRDRIGRDDPFFQVGGNSLAAVQVLSRVRDAWGVEVTLHEFFRAPTVAGLGASLEAARRGGSRAAPPIEPVPRDGGLPLSFAQQRLWFLSELEPESAAYNVPLAVRLTGALDVAALAAGLTGVVRRHETLRTTFASRGGAPVQCIESAPGPFLLPLVDLSRIGPQKRTAEARRLAGAAARRPFDLARGPLLRVTVMRLAEREHTVLAAMHHIVSDGWSMGIFVRELGAFYEALASGSGKAPALPRLAVQYADFARWQRRWLQGEALAGELAYWRERLAGAVSLELPTDRPRAALAAGAAGSLAFAIPETLAGRIRELAGASGATLYMVLLAAFQALLGRHSGQHDVAVGSSIAGRERIETEPLIGFFVNTLVMRVELPARGAGGFAELLERTRELTLGAYAHQALPFEKLVEELRPERDLTRTPFFDVMFELRNVPAVSIGVEGLSLEVLPAASPAAMFDLMVTLEEGPRALFGQAEYDRGLFEATTVRRLLRHFETLLREAVSDPGRSLASLPLLGAGEEHQLLTEWNDTAAAWPEGSVHRLVEARAARAPEAVAVVCGAAALTYAGLNAGANQLARHLGKLGVGRSPEVPVAVLLERSPLMLTAILAIFKAGGVYVPLETTYPEERRSFMLADVGAGVLLTRELLDAAAPAIAAESRRDLPWDPSPRELAYVIYTSGSTGRPKGAMVEHRGMWNHLWIKVGELGLTGGDRLAQTASPCFDISVWQFLAALLVGGRVHVLDDEAAHDPRRLVARVEQEGVTVLESVPSLLRLVLDELGTGGPRLDRLRWMVATGEALAPELVRGWLEAVPGVPLLNAYGPTECSDDVTHHVLGGALPAAALRVPIGHTLANLGLYVLDQCLRPVPSGVVGELAVGGAGVGRGYFGDPRRTAAVFVPDRPGPAGARLYRTGDLVRRLPAGEIEFFGRIGRQVKVRGFRIELGEVEAALSAHPAVRAAAVLVRDDLPGGRGLAGWVAAAGRELPPAETLRASLRQTLPEYMVPAILVVRAALPLSANGKIDRNALAKEPLTGLEETGARVLVAPRSPLEARLAEIWKEVLGLRRIGVEDDFFAAGGHSLVATQLISRVRGAFEVDLPLAAIFEGPTVAAMARAIAREKAAGRSARRLPEIRPDLAARHLPFPLTDVQQAYWVGRGGGLELGSVSAHVYFEGDVRHLDLGRLGRALNRLIERHDMLRAVVGPDGRQRILSEVAPYEIAVLDLGDADPESTADRLREVRSEMSHQLLPSDRWPLFEIRATRLAAAAGSPATRLHVSLDVLIADAWSFRILRAELAALYRDPEAALAPLELSFRDYVLAEHALRQSERFERDLAYWRRRVESLPPAPDLPLAVAPETIARPRFVRHRGGLAAAAWSRLRRRATAAGLTASAVLLAVYAEVLGAWSRSRRFTLNLTLFNRLPLHAQVERIVGDFTSLTLLEVDAGRGAASFAERARAIQRRLWEDLDHGLVSGVRVIQELARARGSRPGALMPVVFTSILDLGRDPGGSPAAAGEDAAGGAAGSAEGDAAQGSRGGETAFGISQTPQVWLDLQVSEHRGALVYECDAVEALFPDGLLADLVAAFGRLCERLAASGEAWHGPLPRLLPPAQEELMARANATAVPRSAELLHGRFAAAAERHPERAAVIAPERTVRYGELSAGARRLGAYLRERGARPNRLVAVVMEKGWEQVLAVLGVLESGAAYLPIDANLPPARQRYLLETCEVELALVQPGLEGHPQRVEHVVVDGSWLAGDEVPASRPRQAPDDLAYVIFTSGSTGRPKGVMIDHRGAFNTVADVNARFAVGPEDRVLGVSALNFDLSVWDVFGTLAAGAALVLPAAGTRPDPAHWLELVARSAVTVWSSVPALLEMAVETTAPRSDGALSSLRTVLLSGDWIPVDLPDRVRRLAGEDLRVVSLGGATEASIWSIFYPVGAVRPEWSSIPYGKPLANQSFHVLDRAAAPCPVWVTGELAIGGAGLSLGYFREARKTAASFVPHPRGTEPGERLYRTGDLGRYLPDGNLEFLGREDFQVKIRGHRIELGEVEVSLAEIEGVRQAVVAAVGEARGDRRLTAWVVPEAGWLAPSEPAAPEPPASPESRAALPRRRLRGKVEILEFKLGQPGLRRDVGSRPSVGLFRPPPDESFLAPFYHRQSYREFADRPVAAADLAAVAEAAESGPGGRGLALLVYARPRRVAGLAGGLYRFRDGTFEAAGAVDLTAEHVAGDNRPIFEQSALAVFVVGHAETWRGLHGAEAELRALAAAGALGQALMEEGPGRGLGFCPLGNFAREPLDTVCGREGLVLLHTLLAGGLRQPEPAPREDAPPGPEPGEVLGRFLAGLIQVDLPEFPLPKYRYPSAGNLYPVQTYVRIPPGSGAGVEPGIYYHHPRTHRLAQLAHGLEGVAGAPASPEVFLVGKVGAVTPIYGDLDRAFCALEAGYVSELLRRVGKGLGITLAELPAPAGRAALAGPLALDDDHLVLAGFSLSGLDARPELAPRAQRLPPREAERRETPERFAERLRRRLGEVLPEYMVPRSFVVLDALPLTANGKVDRGALPAPAGAAEPAARPASLPGPAGIGGSAVVEELVCELAAELLGRERVSAGDDFFALGGHSLLATRLASRMREVFQVELPLRLFFESATLADLAARVGELMRAERGLELPPLEPRRRPPRPPLSFAQERLWFLQKLQPENPFYNVPSAQVLSGALDVTVLRRAFQALTERHESLRTGFGEEGGLPFQQIATELVAAVPVVDLRTLTPEARRAETRRQCLRESRRPFDLGRAPLVRMVVLSLEGAEGSRRAEHVLFVNFHHTIADAWSQVVVAEELSALYTAFSEGRPSPLEPLAVQFADYAAWQRSWLEGDLLERQLDHWRARLAGVANLELATDRPRPPVQSYRGGYRPFELPPELDGELRALCRRRGVTLYMVLLAAFKAMLGRASGQTDVAVGTAVAGRTHVLTEGLIGFFDNTLVLRSPRVDPAASFADLLAAVRETALAAYAHQDLPFERLVEELRPARDLSRSPLFQVMCHLDNTPRARLDLPGVRRGLLDADDQTALFDLTLFLREAGGRVAGALNYAVALFDPTSAERLKRHYLNLLRGAAESARRTLAELPLLSAAEEHALRVEQVPVAAPARPAQWRHVPVALEGLPTAGELREFLRARLPDYMIPAAFVYLESFPLTSSGKRDPKALPAPEDVASPDEDFVGPRGPVEELVAGILARLLGLERVGVDANFFELGGHSLVVTQLIARLREAFGVELSVQTVFVGPTVAELAAGIEAEMRSGRATPLPSLGKTRRDRPLPLSFAQERLWFLDQLEPGSAAYNIPLAVRWQGRLEVPALAAALGEIVRRHESLRTTFSAPAGEPAQVIRPAEDAGAFRLPQVDLERLDPSVRDREARRLARAAVRLPFDLGRGPLYRVTLVARGPEEHTLLVTLHHIISDEWSMGVLIREFAAFYEGFAAPRPAAPELPEPELQYADFAAWQRRWLAGEALEAQLEHWKGRLLPLPPVLELPADRPHSAARRSAGSNLTTDLGMRLSAELRRLAAERGTTLFMTVLAGLKALLSRYTGQHDLAVGTPIAGRNLLATEGLIGFFVNTLVLRTEFQSLRHDRGEARFADLLARVRETSLAAYSHQDLPFEKLVAELAPDRDLGHTPLFQVMFVLRAGMAPEPEIRGARLGLLAPESAAPKFDLTFFLEERGGRLGGWLEYDAALFDSTTMRRFSGHFRRLLAGAAEAPERPLSALPLLAAAERHQMTVAWERHFPLRVHPDGTASSPAAESLHELFAARAARIPDRVAASGIAPESALTYGELARRSRRLAAHLRRLGVRPDVPVGIALERSPETAAAVLAVLAAGGTCLPLDLAYPRGRLAFMLADSGAAVLLTRSRWRRALPELPPEVAVVDLDRVTPGGGDEALPAGAGGNLAYVLYTSGSTGRPKGVALPHQALVNLVRWHLDELANGVRTLQFAPLSFDASFHEMFAAWLSGGSLCVVPESMRQDVPALARFLVEQEVEEAVLPVVVLHLLAAEWEGHGPLPTALREVTATGEQLQVTPAVINLFERLPGVLLHNHYGPSETHVVTAHTLAGAPAGWPYLPSIGRPIPNTSLYLLDRSLEPVPLGAAGELFLGGICLARGYYRRPGQSAERFLPHHLSAAPGERLYRTGDLARHLPNGLTEFLGRIDHQLKLRGFRIEPGEVEAALVEHPRVREAAVLGRPAGAGSGDLRLVAYVVGDGKPAPTAEELRRFLGARLPGHMVPSAFVALESFPLTPNGKLDRRALPEPEWERGPRTLFVAPRTPVEEILANIWTELLPVDEVGVHENFFDLEGHSLLATRLVSRIRDSFGVELAVRTVFEHPTTATLAVEVERAMRSGKRPLPPLEPAGRHRPPPLSFAQQRLWFLDQLEPGGSAYNVPVALVVRGPLDAAVLAASFTGVARRHETLRTTFAAATGEPVQRIAAAREVPLPRIDLAGLAAARRKDEARRLAREEMRRPFDLAAGPLLRLSLARLEEERHLLLVTLHHIVSDGWSIGILVREAAELYEAGLAGRAAALARLPVQYADFACWQRRVLSGEVLEQELAYWKERLSPPPVLDLPTDRPRPAVRTGRGASRVFALPPRLVEELHGLGRAHGTTLYMTLLAAFQALLGRWSGRADVAVGTPVAGRRRLEVEALIGFFVNTLVMRSDLGVCGAFAELLAQVRELTLGAYAHQDLPFEKLVEELAPQRDMSRTPLFEVVLVLQNAPLETPRVAGLRLEPLPFESTAAKFDLTLTLEESAGGLEGVAEFDRDLYDSTTVRRLLRHLEVLLHGAVADPATALARLPLLSASERHQVAAEWAAGARPAAPELCLHRMVEARVERTPDAAAVTFEGRAWTYAELNARANRLARRLRRHGVGPEVPVAVCVERSPAMLAALLAILKAGGYYVPIDPAHPEERRSFVLADALAQAEKPLLLTESRLAPADSPYTALLVDREDTSAASSADLAAGPAPENLAYVIYTSGSTGRPKGVAISHRSLVSFLESMRGRPGLRAGETLLALTTLSFDIAGLELYLPLVAGGRVLLASRTTAADGYRLAELLATSGVDVLQATPATWEMLLAAGWAPPAGGRGALRMLCGGEALPGGLAARLLAAGGELWNLYGPTETTVWSAIGRVGPGSSPAAAPVSLGRPIARTAIRLLDRAGRPVPIGVPGELSIAGGGLARGYLGRPGLSAERFVPDPFAGAPGRRLYRTGDLARRSGGGGLAFLGRLDHQVKVRGYRIELGEVEAVLAAHRAVRGAAVVTPGTPAGAAAARLVAYVSAAAPLDAGDLRRHAAAKLPEYMVPAAFVVLESLPLSPSGKVDRAALARRAWPVPHPDRAVEGARRDPLSPVEEILAGLWAEVLHLDEVGAGDDFFDNGGHSLLATQLVARIHAACGAALPVRAVFEAPTVRALAARVDALAAGPGSAPPPIEPAARDQPLPLSFAQQRLWLLDRLEPGGTAYNVPGAVRLVGRLRPEALRAALTEVVARHEILRTTFPLVRGEPVQEIAPSAAIPPAVVDLSRLEAAERRRQTRRELAREAATPFDLTTGPLVRTRLFRLSGDDHVLSFNLHHILCDGWSQGLLVREVAELYEALSHGRPSPLPPLALQYADYAVWQRRWLRPEVLDEQMAWWRERLGGQIPALDLPTDRPRPRVQSFRGSEHALRLGRELGAELRALSREAGATLFMTLLGALELLLHRWSGEPEVLVGVPVAGRTRPELDELIGLFLNTLVLRTDFGSLGHEATFRGLLEGLREQALGAYAHQDVPFEQIVRELSPERDLARTPLFQVLFNMLNLPPRSSRLTDLEVEPFPSPGTAGAKFDLTVYAATVSARGPRSREGAGEEIDLRLVYNAELFDPQRIEEFAAQLRTLLEQVAAGAGEKLGRYSLLTPAARRLLCDPAAELAQPAFEPVGRTFRNRAEQQPDLPAVEGGGRVWSYAELEARALEVARRVIERGVKPGHVVAVRSPRSPELVAAVLGVALAGGVLLTLGRRLPETRLRTLLREADARLLVYVGATRPEDRWMETAVPTLTLAVDEPSPAAAAVELPEPAPDDPAYVFFTSGSTGTPKGVLGRQKSLAHFLSWQARTFDVGPGDRVAQLVSLAFDVVLRDLFLPLTSGATLCLPPEDADSADARAVLPWLARIRASVLHPVPSLAALWLERLPPGLRLTALRWTFFAGEPLSGDLVREWRARLAPAGEVVNLYGPTETTLAKCSFRVADPPAPGRQPVGRALPGAQALVMAPDGRRCGLAELGEIVIRTPFTSLGYLHPAPDDARRFRRNPFRDDPEDLIYFTGDQGRYRPDGELEILGRLDDQIKIRAMRVEPAEVEAALGRLGEVAHSAVLARRDPAGELRLVAYAVPAAGQLEASGLRERLREELPEHMVPAMFVELASLPRTPTGKVDRRALPEPEWNAGAQRPGRGPRTRLEGVLASLWAEVLGLHQVGVRDKFFDLGGHSFSAVRLLTRIEDELGRKLSLASLFAGPTIEEQARLLGRGAAPTASCLIPIRGSGRERPLFLVHPAGGDVLGYRELADALGPEQPVYALRARGLDDGEAPYARIEDMAARYVDELGTVDSAGPYRLGGWSLGGTVAFEMARQLHDAGRRVAQLFLIDSWRPGPQPEPGDEDAWVWDFLLEELGTSWQSLGLAREAFLDRPARERLARLLAAARSAGTLPPDVDFPSVARRFEVFRTHLRAAREYTPRPLDLEGLYFQAGKRAAREDGRERGEAWRELLTAGLEVHAVSADHRTIVRGENARTLAELIRRLWDREKELSPAEGL